MLLVMEMTNIAHKDDVGQVLSMMTIMMEIMLIMMMTIFKLIRALGPGRPSAGRA